MGEVEDSALSNINFLSQQNKQSLIAITKKFSPKSYKSKSKSLPTVLAGLLRVSILSLKFRIKINFLTQLVSGSKESSTHL
jgi:hypothetical protein